MIERLQTIISHYALTPSALADSIGVPRSSISHLLSGRNKPSLDFVLKLVKKYPEVNLYWFLQGQGSFPGSTDTDFTTTPLSTMATHRPKKKIPLTQNAKSVAKIVILYEDGTFETYQPNQ